MYILWECWAIHIMSALKTLRFFYIQEIVRISNRSHHNYIWIQGRKDTYFLLCCFPFTFIPSNLSALLTSSSGFLSFTSLSDSAKGWTEQGVFSTTSWLSLGLKFSAFSLSLALIASFFNSLQNSVIWFRIGLPANKFLADKVDLKEGTLWSSKVWSTKFFFSSLDLIASLTGLTLEGGGVTKFGSWFSLSWLNLNLSAWGEAEDSAGILLLIFTSLCHHTKN